jgi:hypothetical protein
MWTYEFWIATAERAIKSAAQAPLVAWGVGDVALDVLTSLASAGIGPTRSPALVGETAPRS